MPIYLHPLHDVHAHAYAHAYTHAYAHAYTHAYAHAYAHAYTHAYACTSESSRGIGIAHYVWGAVAANPLVKHI